MLIYAHPEFQIFYTILHSCMSDHKNRHLHMTPILTLGGTTLKFNEHVDIQKEIHTSK
uniref:Uncharacterized protein n=1 Tax=Arundo donax TaxID=35708 RepID=A0A0A9CSE9_ARUDO